jgi:hypothetical protein
MDKDFALTAGDTAQVWNKNPSVAWYNLTRKANVVERNVVERSERGLAESGGLGNVVYPRCFVRRRDQKGKRGLKAPFQLREAL